MSESLRLFDAEASNAIYDAYTVTTRYNESIQEMNSLDAQSDEILREGPLANYAVLIPVAAHQEASSIYKTLGLYSKQQTREPFSVVLNMNYPFASDPLPIGESFAELARAKKDFPQLDVRHFESQYIDPTIGGIRGDLWDATLLAAERGGTITPQRDMICFNHDIDLEKLPRGYIDKLQAVFEQRTDTSNKRLQSLRVLTDEAPIIRPVFGNMKHAFDPSHPNISRANLWFDSLVKIREGGFEAGLVMPMGFYASSGGFSASDTTSEVLGLIERGSDVFPDLIHTPAAETSPRRLIEKLSRPDTTFDEIWSEGSFAATENYRESIQHTSDITEHRLHELISSDSNNLPRYIGISALKARSKHALKDPILDDAHISLELDELSLSDIAILNQSLEDHLVAPSKLAHAILSRIIKHPHASSITQVARSDAYKKFMLTEDDAR